MIGDGPDIAVKVPAGFRQIANGPAERGKQSASTSRRQRGGPSEEALPTACPDRRGQLTPGLRLASMAWSFCRVVVSRPIAFAVLLTTACASPLASQEAGLPIPEDERLSYAIAWPSGLAVGSAAFRARYVDPGWRFEMTLIASLPEIEIDDAYVSRTDAATCSLEFEKHVRHGAKRVHESLRFGPDALERTNLEGDRLAGPGIVPVSGCARDALAFLYYLRKDLAAGRVPPPADIFFGAGYSLKLEYVQTRRLILEGERRLADEIRTVVRGPASEHAFSVFFGRDEARTPLLFRMEFEGTPFTMQLTEHE